MLLATGKVLPPLYAGFESRVHVDDVKECGRGREERSNKNGPSAQTGGPQFEEKHRA
jgi:hypothetical protein